jgi:hypothetical protein
MDYLAAWSDRSPDRASWHTTYFLPRVDACPDQPLELATSQTEALRHMTTIRDGDLDSEGINRSAMTDCASLMRSATFQAQLATCSRPWNIWPSYAWCGAHAPREALNAENVLSPHVSATLSLRLYSPMYLP